MAEQDPTGVPSGEPTDQASGSGDSDKFVKRETLLKSLAAEKNSKAKNKELSAKLSEYEAKEQAVQEQQLLDEKKYSQVIEDQKLKISELETQNNGLNKNMSDFQKMTAVMGVMQEKGIQLDQKYLGLVPIDQVQLDDSGQVDLKSASDVVNNFQTEHPRLTLPQKLLPNDKSGSVQSKMSMDDWKKLDYDAKQKALKEGRVKHDHQF